jgi:hypothetical protein
MVRPRHPKKKADVEANYFGRNSYTLSVSTSAAGRVTEVNGRPGEGEHKPLIQQNIRGVAGRHQALGVSVVAHRTLERSGLSQHAGKPVASVRGHKPGHGLLDGGRRARRALRDPEADGDCYAPTTCARTEGGPRSQQIGSL